MLRIGQGQTYQQNTQKKAVGFGLSNMEWGRELRKIGSIATHDGNKVAYREALINRAKELVTPDLEKGNFIGAYEDADRMHAIGIRRMFLASKKEDMVAFNNADAISGAAQRVIDHVQSVGRKSDEFARFLFDKARATVLKGSKSL